MEEEKREGKKKKKKEERYLKRIIQVQRSSFCTYAWVRNSAKAYCDRQITPKHLNEAFIAKSILIKLCIYRAEAVDTFTSMLYMQHSNTALSALLSGGVVYPSRA